MTKKYINEKFVITIYIAKCKYTSKTIQTINKLDELLKSYITYEFIVSFQLYRKNSNHVNSQQASR
jgi:hypothetical protein